jgi:hypothetical protein
VTIGIPNSINFIGGQVMKGSVFIAAVAISVISMAGTAWAQHAGHHPDNGTGTTPAQMECTGSDNGCGCCCGKMSTEENNGMGSCMMGGAMMGNGMMGGGMRDHKMMMECMMGSSASQGMGTDMKMCCTMKGGEKKEPCESTSDGKMKCCKHKKTDQKDTMMDASAKHPDLK